MSFVKPQDHIKHSFDFLKLSVLTIMLLLWLRMYSQDVSVQNTFEFSFGLGLTYSGLSGDSIPGLSALSLRPNMRTSVGINKNLSLGLEMAYTRLGSKSASQNLEFFVNVVETELLAIYSDWSSKGGRRFNFTGGLGWSFILDQNINFTRFERQIDNLEQGFLHSKLGMEYFFDRSNSIWLFYTHSLSPLLRKGNDVPLSVHSNYIAVTFAHKFF